MTPDHPLLFQDNPPNRASQSPSMLGHWRVERHRSTGLLVTEVEHSTEVAAGLIVGGLEVIRPTEVAGHGASRWAGSLSTLAIAVRLRQRNRHPPRGTLLARRVRSGRRGRTQGRDPQVMPRTTPMLTTPALPRFYFSAPRWTYLAAGLPIATGVIEGACRYLVKARMEITGARWSLQGAEAILRLRALVASGDFDENWQFHLKQELLLNHVMSYDELPPSTRFQPSSPRHKDHTFGWSHDVHGTDLPRRSKEPHPDVAALRGKRQL